MQAAHVLSEMITAQVGIERVTALLARRSASWIRPR
jgi:hypothetical protein